MRPMFVAVGTVGARLVVEGAAAADLKLVQNGLRLPWERLGAHLAERQPDRHDAKIAVELPRQLISDVLTSERVVLTDATLLPLALLEEIDLRDAASPSEVSGAATLRGRLVLDPELVTPGWLPVATPIAIAQRPLLDDELDGPLVVLAPTSPSPDGIPAQVLRRALDAAVRDRPDVTVVDAPIWWRDPHSDQALVDALAHRLGRDVTLLHDADPAWRTAGAALERGVAPEGLHEEAAAVLLRWQPPRQRRGLVVFFTGLSGSGKSSLASALVDAIHQHGDRSVSLLDGDLVRRMLSAGLGFDRAGRDANVMRIGFVAAEIAKHGGLAVCAPIAPFAAARQAVREMVQGSGDFVLVHVSTPLEVCEQRDRKGLYAQARSGALADFTGVSSPYEVPEDADLVVDTTGRTLEESLGEVLTHLRDGGWVS